MDFIEKFELFNLCRTEDVGERQVICDSETFTGYTYVWRDMDHFKAFANAFDDDDDKTLDEKVEDVVELLVESPGNVLSLFVTNDDSSTFSDFELKLWQICGSHEAVIETLLLKEEVIEEPVVEQEPVIVEEPQPVIVEEPQPVIEEEPQPVIEVDEELTAIQYFFNSRGTVDCQRVLYAIARLVADDETLARPMLTLVSETFVVGNKEYAIKILEKYQELFGGN